MAEFTEDFLASIGNMMDSKMLDVNTSIDGVIVSYADGLATVQPVGQKRFADGDALDFPPIRRVPVRWPSFNGGQSGFKGPVTPGDKCQLIFSQQASDGSDDMRRFDLTDAYAIIASNETVQGGGNNDDCIMWFGTASIRITAGGQVIIKAPAGVVYDAPTNDYNGSQTTQGSINGQGGFNISGGASGTANVTGNVNITGTLTNNGKAVGSTHTHGGVQTGSGTTGQPT